MPERIIGEFSSIIGAAPCWSHCVFFTEMASFSSNCYLKPSYFSGTLILAILARGLMIAKFNTC